MFGVVGVFCNLHACLHVHTIFVRCSKASHFCSKYAVMTVIVNVMNIILIRLSKCTKLMRVFFKQGSTETKVKKSASRQLNISYLTCFPFTIISIATVCKRFCIIIQRSPLGTILFNSSGAIFH